MRHILLVSVLAACASESAPAEVDLGPAPPPGTGAAVPAAAPALNPRLLRRFRSLSAPPALAPALVALGKQLFHETRLSRHGDVSCSSCHQLDRGGDDDRPRSVGAGGKSGRRNSPTVFNASLHVAQFWDGRSASLDKQAAEPLLDAREMGMGDERAVVATLRALPGYRDAFAAAFPGEAEPVTFANTTTAIAAFERTLITPSRWDDFLDGDTSALSAHQIEGMRLFADVGCVQCHTGELVGGSMFQRAGVMLPWPAQGDQGRYEVTRVESDRMLFKVPSLRNVALTAPYFHDGSVPVLTEAIRMMGQYQLGIELSPEETGAIAAWLEALSGAPPADALVPPVLPPDR